jgi:anti-anti-sigma factor
MPSEPVPLGFSGLTAPVGSHIAFSYGAEAERQAPLFAFIAAGLKNHERCIAAVAEYAPDLWRRGLREAGADPDAAQEGQLEVLTPGRLVPGLTSEAARTATSLLDSLIESSSKEGWRATRVCTSLTPLYQCELALAEMLAAEAKSNDSSRDKPVTRLCTFAEHRLHPRLIEACLNCHPFSTDGASLAQNDGYLDPSAMAQELPELLRKLRAAGALAPPFALLDFYENMPVIRTGDEMDAYTAPGVEELAQWMMDTGHRKLVIDLSVTTFMDAASISALIRIALELEKRGGRLAIYDPGEIPRKIFTLIKFHERVPVRRLVGEAAAATDG